jgi:hypothetical protein
MNTKSILFLSCFTAMAMAATAAMAAPRGGGHFASMPARGGGRPFIHNSMGQWNGGHWNGGNWGGNWHNHHHGHNDVIFIGGFGYPFWGWGYPYDYGYGYYPGGYYPYGYNGYGYNNGGYGYGYNNNGYGYGYSNHSRVAEMQRRLAHAGYYHGAIDGIMGPQTRRALRGYRLDQGTGAYAE